jgi:hypothetical protein
MNPFAHYDAGYEAGLQCHDRCPHLPFTFGWFWWQAGFFVGHQVLCAQMEFIAAHHQED